MNDWDRVTANIRQDLLDYCTRHNIKALVLGMSGGIDSTLCAALAHPVCRDHGIALIGRSLPCGTNKPDELKRAALAGRAFCTDYREIHIDHWYDALMDMNEDEPDADQAARMRLGNFKARLRMIYLYNMAARHKGLVLSTDNLTELQLGFWTLCGDVGDLSMIQMLWKTEVYELSAWLAGELQADRELEKANALRMAIDAVPTDGLGISESDLDQINPGGTYAEVDEILKQWLDRKPLAFKDHPTVRKHEATHYKRSWPCNFTRGQLFR